MMVKRSVEAGSSCEVMKEVVCENCTEEQSRSDPFTFSVGEIELETIDVSVEKVEPNE